MLTRFADSRLHRALMPLAALPLLAAALAMTAAPTESAADFQPPVVRLAAVTDTVPSLSAIPSFGGISEEAMEAAGAPVAPAALVFSLDRLMIPVAGIAPTDLVDTYTAPRSGGRTHHAIDIVAEHGTPVVAISDGRIVRRHTNRLGGKVLYLASPDGRYSFYYAHLARYAPGIEVGRTVFQGDTLGFVGNTGNARHTVPHLHFQVIQTNGSGRYYRGRKVNPYPLLRRSALYREADGRVRG